MIFSDSYLNSVSILPLVSTWWVCCLYFNVFFSHLNNNFFWNYFAFNLTIQTKCKLNIQHGAHLTAVIPLSIVWVLLWLFSTFGVSFVFILGKYLTLQVPYHYLSIKLKSGQNHLSFFHLLGVLEFSTFGVSFVFILGKYLTLQVPYHYLSIKLKSGQNHLSFFHLLGVSAQVS